MANNNIGAKIFSQSFNSRDIEATYNKIVSVISKETGKAEDEIKKEIDNLNFGEDLQKKIIEEFEKAEKKIGGKSFSFSKDLFKGLFDSKGSEEEINKVVKIFENKIESIINLKNRIGDDNIFANMMANIDTKQLDELIEKEREFLKLEQERQNLTGANKSRVTRQRNTLDKELNASVEQIKIDFNVNSSKINKADEALKKYNVSQEEALKKAKELSKQRNVASSYIDKDNINDIKDMVAYMQRYIELVKQAGGTEDEALKKLRSEVGPSNVRRLTGASGDTGYSDYKDEIQSIRTEIATLNQEARGIGGQVFDDSKLKEQEQEINRLTESLGKTQAELDSINQKYTEQTNLVSELRKQTQALEGINDPKVLESDEYKKLTEELRIAESNASEFKNELEYAEDTVKRLQKSLNAYNTNDVVPREQWENASSLVDLLYDKIDKLKTSLTESEQRAESLSNQMNALQQDNTSLDEQLSQQKQINESQKEQISNLEKIKSELQNYRKQYQELLNTIKEVESAQQQAMSLADNAGRIEAFNSAVRNVNYNEGIDTPEGFVNFDYLDKAKQKLEETGDKYEKLIKAAVYYNQYLQKGGTEKILNADGKDISEQLISVYAEMSRLAKENGEISQESAIQFVRDSASELTALRAKSSELEENCKKLEKQLKLQKEISKENQQTRTEPEAETSTEKSSAKKMSKDELRQAMKKDEEKKAKQTQSSSEQVISEPVQIYPDIDQEEWLRKISETLKSIRAKVDPFNLDLDIDNWITVVENKLTEISGKKVKLDVDVDATLLPSNDTDNNTSSQEERHAKEVAEAQKKYEEQLLAEKKKREKEYTAWWTSELNNRDQIQKQLQAEEARYQKELDKQLEKENAALNKSQIDKFNQFMAEDKNQDTKAKTEEYAKLEAAVVEYGNLQEKIAKSNNEATQEQIDKLKELENTINSISKGISEKGLYSDSKEKNIAGKLLKSDSNVVDISSAVENAKNSLNSLKNDFNTDVLKQVFSEAEVALNNLNNEFAETNMTLPQYKKNVDAIINSLSKKQNVVGIFDKNNILEAQQAMTTYAMTVRNVEQSSIKWNKAGNQLTATFTDQNGQLRTLILNAKVAEGQFSETFGAPVKKASSFSKFIDELNVKFRNLATYLASFVGFYEIWGQIKQGVTYVKELDTALTEMKKVSNETTTSLREFQKASFDIADSVGATAQVIQNSTAEWMRLGESLEQASESAQVSNILLNVSEFENIDDATESLVAMSQAYQEFEKIDIVDKLNNIGNNYSIATDGIAEALQRSASSLTTAGNTLDEAIALVTAGNSIVQDPESVGAGLRTISLRLVGTEEAKKQLEALGEEAANITSSKMRDIIMSATKVASNEFQGFDILDENGNYKSTYEILQGIADIYDEIVETDKKFGTNNLNLLLENLAGKNRSNIAASILQNADLLRSVYESSQDSEGSAQQELDKYLDSIEGKLTRLTNSVQKFWDTFIDTDIVKGAIDLLTNLMDGITGLVDSFGSLASLATVISSIFSIKTGGGRAKIFVILRKLITHRSLILVYGN